MKPLQPCRLCGNAAVLRNSHIIPEYFYKAWYEDGHKLNLVSTNPRISNGIVHKGVREYLLGDCCERLLKNHEECVRTALYGSGRLLSTDNWEQMAPSGGQKYFVIPAPDPLHLRHFQLSVLWRAHHSKHPLFSAVSLSPEIERYLKNILCGTEPDDVTRVSCLMAVGLFWGNLRLDAVLSPDSYALSGIPSYQFWFGGILWNYKLPIEGQVNPYPVHQLVQSTPTLKLVLPAVEVSTTRWFQDYADELVSTGRLADANRRAGLT